MHAYNVCILFKQAIMQKAYMAYSKPIASMYAYTYVYR